MPTSKPQIVGLNYRLWDDIEACDDASMELVLEQFLLNHHPALTSYRQMVELCRKLTQLVYLSHEVLEPNLTNFKQAYRLDKQLVKHHLLDWVRDEPLTGLEVIPEPKIWMP